MGNCFDNKKQMKISDLNTVQKLDDLEINYKKASGLEVSFSQIYDMNKYFDELIDRNQMVKSLDINISNTILNEQEFYQILSVLNKYEGFIKISIDFTNNKMRDNDISALFTELKLHFKTLRQLKLNFSGQTFFKQKFIRRQVCKWIERILNNYEGLNDFINFRFITVLQYIFRNHINEDNFKQIIDSIFQLNIIQELSLTFKLLSLKNQEMIYLISKIMSYSFLINLSLNFEQQVQFIKKLD